MGACRGVIVLEPRNPTGGVEDCGVLWSQREGLGGETGGLFPGGWRFTEQAGQVIEGGGMFWVPREQETQLFGGQVGRVVGLVDKRQTVAENGIVRVLVEPMLKQACGGIEVPIGQVGFAEEMNA